MIETRPKKNHERAVLVGLEQAGVSKWDLKDSLDELAELANSAGAEVVDTVTQKLQKPTSVVTLTCPGRLFIGPLRYRLAGGRAGSDSWYSCPRDSFKSGSERPGRRF